MMWKYYNNSHKKHARCSRIDCPKYWIQNITYSLIGFTWPKVLTRISNCQYRYAAQFLTYLPTRVFPQAAIEKNRTKIDITFVEHILNRRQAINIFRKMFIKNLLFLNFLKMIMFYFLKANTVFAFCQQDAIYQLSQTVQFL